MAQLAVERGVSAHDVEKMRFPFEDQLENEKLIFRMYPHHWSVRKPFDECANCPLQASKAIAEANSIICFRPDHWQELFDAGVKIAQAAAEAERQKLLERAQAGQLKNTVAEVVETIDRRVQRNAADEARKQDPYQERRANVAPKGLSLNDLSYGQYERVPENGGPAACTEDCPCRVKVRDGTRLVAVCLDPKRFNGLKASETRTRQKDRKVVYERLRTEIVTMPMVGNLNLSAALCLMPVIAGTPVDVRRRYVACMASNHELFAATPKEFVALLEGGYFRGDDRNAIRIGAQMEANVLIAHARNLFVFRELHYALENRTDISHEVQLLLGVNATGDRVEEVEAENGSPGYFEGNAIDEDTEGQNDLEDEAVFCERCIDDIAKHALGTPAAEESRFLEATDRERVLTRLESGVLAVNVLATGDVWFYCAECARG